VTAEFSVYPGYEVLKFPPNLSTEHRNFVHQLALRFGLECQSQS